MEYVDATEVDDGYYGVVDIHAPILLISNKESLSDDELINEFIKTLNIEYLFDALNELKELYKNNPAPKLKKLKEDLKETNLKINKANKSLVIMKELGLNTSELKSELKSIIKKLTSLVSKYKSEIKELEKLKSNFDEVLYKKENDLYQNSDFCKLTDTTDIESFINSGETINIKKLALNKYQLNFIKFLISRGWEYVDLSKPLNEVSDVNCVKVKELYERINAELNVK